ncbi:MULTISPECIES: hypothetical protein [Bacteria]
MIVVLAVVVAVLAIMAIDRSRPGPTNESLAPIPTFNAAPPQPSATPAPTDTPLQPVPRADERFLSIGSEGILWRGVAGSCADGAAPMIERSANGGGSWNDVTPLYLGIGQITRLDAFAGTQAQTVAILGEDRTADGLRTFTQGRFWESYEEVLATSAYIAADDPALVITPDGAIAAPCADARGLRQDGDTIALVCGAAVFTLVDNQLQTLSVEDAAAVAVDGSTIVVAGASADCAGLALTTVTDGAPTPVACVEGADPAAPTAITLLDGVVVIWAGETYTTLPVR